MSVGWRQISSLVFGDVYFLPIAADDAFADLRGGLTLAGLFKRVEGFPLADVATCTVTAGKAIEKAAVTLAAVTVAVAGLLVENFADAGGDGVGVEDELVRVDGPFQYGRQGTLGGSGWKAGVGSSEAAWVMPAICCGRERAKSGRRKRTAAAASKEQADKILRKEIMYPSFCVTS